jgi:hypothetical protein
MIHDMNTAKEIRMPLTVTRTGALGVRCALALLAAVVLLFATGVPAPARAVEPAPAWKLRALASPTTFSSTPPAASRDQQRYFVSLTNVGGAHSDGTPITVTGAVAPGLTLEVEAREWSCTESGSSFSCEYEGTVGSLDQVELIEVFVYVAPGVSADTMATSTFTVSGGGGPAASSSVATLVEPSAPALWGAQDLFSFPADAAGGLDTQAGAHPNALIAGVDFASEAPKIDPDGETGSGVAVESVKDVAFDLPVGFSGDPQAVPECPLSALIRNNGETGTQESNCPAASQIGTIDLFTKFQFIQATSGRLDVGGPPIPVFNMVPEPGHPAEFGTAYLGFPAILYPSVVGSGADAHLRVTATGIPASDFIGFKGAQLTIFGDPAKRAGGASPAGAFLTNPSWCSGEPLTTTAYGDSYEHPGARNADGSPDTSDPTWVRTSTTTPASTGCEALHFNPSIDLRPDTTQADSPAAVGIDAHFPQNTDPDGLATPDLKEVTVALPEGMSVSPSAADGLQACSDAQFNVSSHERASCPAASRLGTVTAKTPILAAPLEGQVFVGSPECSPCTLSDAQSGRMLRLFMQIEGPGIVLKFPGTVSVDPVTSRLTANFKNIIQQPVSDVLVQLKGGPRAPLATSQSCGVASTTSDLVPWSSPQTPDGTPSSSFTVDWDGNGGACPGVLPFSPGFSGGTITPLAGGFSPFTLTFSRQDREQDLSGLSVKMPLGLLGIIKGTPLCEEPQAAQGTCSAASEVGNTNVAAGAGSHPYWVSGKVYLTGPYEGAPFGLSVVVPAKAGPFDLGNVIVRAAIQIDPHTAQVTVVSDPFPQTLDGISLRIKTVNVSVDRPGFIFNPTDCAAQQLTATITAAQGASANVSSPFTVGGCADLPFHPVFSVSTQAKTSKKDGASLIVKTTYPTGPQSNIRSVAVSLPKQLPSRLTTIQQACPGAVFAANPASCPAGSDIGIVTASTPILANPVVGPAYLVSHGGAAFPDLVVILQGEGVTVELVGSIDIKKGVTSSTFASLPDAPIESFTLTLPEGPHSALTTNLPAKAKGNLCGQSLAMPTTIVGQNGAQIKQSTKIAVTGCPKVKPGSKAKAKKHKKAKKK